MSMTEAVAYKIIKYCDENKLSINRFALNCILTQSTIENIILNKTKNITISTLYHICYGMNMKLYEFYSDKIFDDVVPETLL